MTIAIEFTGVTKKFGQVLAGDELNAVAQPGEVTALPGPNGAGKTTTLRMLLGLVASSSGTATIGGMRYDELPVPKVGDETTPMSLDDADLLAMVVGTSFGAPLVLVLLLGGITFTHEFR